MSESTEPCGTPFLKCSVGDGLPLYFVYASLPDNHVAHDVGDIALGCFWVSSVS